MHQSKIKQADVYKNSLIYGETPFLSIHEKQVFQIVCTLWPGPVDDVTEEF